MKLPDKDTVKKLVAAAVLALISAVAFCVDYNTEQVITMSSKLVVTALVLLLFYYFTLSKIIKTDIGLVLLSVCLSGVWLLCLSFLEYGGFTEVFEKGVNLEKSILFFAGMAIFIYLFLAFLDYACGLDGTVESGKINIFSFSSVFAIMLLAWLPAVIFFYPGEISFDAYDQLYQGLGMKDILAHHPPTASYFFAGLIDISYRLFGSGNIGLFSIILIQYLAYSSIIAYGTSTMINDLKVPKWIGVFSILYPIVVPFYISYITCVIKDVLFSAGMMLLCIELIVFVFDTEQFFAGYKHFILLFLASLLSVVFRHNGKYILVAVLIFMVIYLCGNKLPNILRKVAYISVPILVCSAFVVVFPIVKQIPKGETVEMLCMPLQELARTAKYTPEYFSEEDKEIISKCIDFDLLADSYNPICVDHTKGYVNDNNPGAEEIFDLLGVWIKLIVKHPEIPLLTTMGEFHMCFYPFEANILNDTLHSYDWLGMREKYNITYPEAFDSIREGFQVWLGNWYSVPVITFLSGLGFDNMVLLGLLYFSLRKKDFFRFLIPALPAILSEVFILIGPCIFYNQRYGFPIMFTIPFLLGTYSYISHMSSEKKQ